QRQALVEMIAEQDDALMEKYFEAGELTQNEVLSGLKKTMLDRKIIPIFCSSALFNIGAQPLLDAMVELLPNPAESRVMMPAQNLKDHSKMEVKIDPSGHLSAFVFKTFVDPYAGRVNLFRVITGIMKADHGVLNVNKGNNEKIATISVLQGK